MNDQQIAKVQALAVAVDCNFDHDANAWGYVVAIRGALTRPDNDTEVRRGLINLATYLDGKESAAGLVDQIDDLVDELA
jgi:hypothetical protein